MKDFNEMLFQKGRRALWVICAAVGLFSCFSCSDEWEGGGSSGGGSTLPAENVKVNLSFSTPSSTGKASGNTNTAPDFEDNFQDDFWVLVFTPVTNDQGQALDKYDQPITDGDLTKQARRYYVARHIMPDDIQNATNPGEYTASFYLPPDLFVNKDGSTTGKVRTNFTMLFLANASDVWNEVGAGGTVIQNPDKVFLQDIYAHQYRGITLEEAKDLLTLSYQSADSKGWKDLSSKGIPMSAELVHTVKEYHLGYQLDDVHLLRAMGRVDVGLNYQTSQGGSTAEATAQGFPHFKLANVYVMNSWNKLLAGYDTQNVTAGGTSPYYTVSAPTLPELTDADNKVTSFAAYPDKAAASYDYTAADLTNAIEKAIYLPEQDITTAMKNVTDRTKQPCIIVAGYYGADNVNDPTNVKARLSYYRLDFVKAQSDAGITYNDILRGQRIRFNITAVNGPGFPTLEDALNNLSANITVQVDAWQEVNANTVFDGQRFLSVERMAVSMPRENNVHFKLLAQFNGDLTWDDITLGYERQADANGTVEQVFPTTSGGTVTPQNPITVQPYTYAQARPAARFTVEKKRDATNNVYYFDISTARAYSAAVDANPAPDILLLKAKNLLLKISLTQKNISLADWEYGNTGSGEVNDGSVFNAVSFVFAAPGASGVLNLFDNHSNLTVEMNSGSNWSEIAALDSTTVSEQWQTLYRKIKWCDAAGEPLDDRIYPSWLQLCKSKAGAERSITLVAGINTSGDDRYAYFRAARTTTDGTVYTVIAVRQTPFNTTDFYVSGMDLTFRDRNVGATGNSASTFYGNNYRKDKLSDDLCPSGWFVPSKEDYENLIAQYQNGGIRFYQYVYPNGADTDGALGALMIYNGKTTQASSSVDQFPLTKFKANPSSPGGFELVGNLVWARSRTVTGADNANGWKENEGWKLLQVGLEKGTIGGYETVIPTITEVTDNVDNTEAKLRCVRGFHLDKGLLTLGSLGLQETLDYKTNTTTEVPRITVSNPPLGITVTPNSRKDRQLLVNSAVNWTDNYQSALYTFTTTGGRTEMLRVQVSKTLPVTNSIDNFIEIDGTIWASVNLGAPDLTSYGGTRNFDNTAYLKYSRGILSSEVLPGTNMGTPNGTDKYAAVREKDTECARKFGAGFRVPTTDEWAALARRMRVETRLARNDGRQAYLYSVSDGKTITYFPGLNGINTSTPVFGSGTDGSYTLYLSRDAEGEGARAVAFRQYVPNASSNNMTNTLPDADFNLSTDDSRIIRSVWALSGERINVFTRCVKTKTN